VSLERQAHANRNTDPQSFSSAMQKGGVAVQTERRGLKKVELQLERQSLRVDADRTTISQSCHANRKTSGRVYFLFLNRAQCKAALFLSPLQRENFVTVLWTTAHKETELLVVIIVFK
jgi:hypothetical protein